MSSISIISQYSGPSFETPPQNVGGNCLPRGGRGVDPKNALPACLHYYGSCHPMKYYRLDSSLVTVHIKQYVYNCLPIIMVALNTYFIFYLAVVGLSKEVVFHLQESLHYQGVGACKMRSLKRGTAELSVQ